MRVKARTARTHNIWRAASLPQHCPDQRRSQASWDSGEESLISSLLHIEEKELLVTLFGDYLLHSLLLTSPSLSILSKTAKYIFEVIQYIWHKLVVVNDSCLYPAPNLILWVSLHPGINLCASNITSLFGGTIYGHIKMLSEDFFVNRISTLMCNSFSFFKTQLNLTSIKSLLIILKKMGFLSF